MLPAAQPWPLTAQWSVAWRETECETIDKALNPSVLALCRKREIERPPKCYFQCLTTDFAAAVCLQRLNGLGPPGQQTVCQFDGFFVLNTISEYIYEYIKEIQIISTCAGVFTYSNTQVFVCRDLIAVAGHPAPTLSVRQPSQHLIGIC